MLHNVENFCLIGEALFGRTWQTSLAESLLPSMRTKKLAHAVRTVQRWVAADAPIPDGVWGDLAKLCADRSAALTILTLRLTA